MPNSITIRYNADWEQYEVPGPDGTEAQTYYTTDRTDAVDTALVVFGPDVEIKIRRN